MPAESMDETLLATPSLEPAAEDAESAGVCVCESTKGEGAMRTSANLRD